MSFAYTMRESLSGFKRTKLSSFISIVTICISLLLLGIFALVTINTSRLIDAIRNRVEMEAFLQEPLSDDEIVEIKKSVAGIEGVDKVVFVSKDEAAKIFKREFGEDVTDVLNFNPLPPSLKITLKDPYKTATRAAALNDHLMAVKGIESVVYRKALLDLIDRRTAAIHNISLGLGMLISLSAIFLVSNTIRLAIYAKRNLIRTMELVGATWGFIRLPFLLEGMIHGLLGGLAAAGILYIALEYALRMMSEELAVFGHMQPVFYSSVIAGGIALGLVGSIISVGRFIRPPR